MNHRRRRRSSLPKPALPFQHTRHAHSLHSHKNKLPPPPPPLVRGHVQGAHDDSGARPREDLGRGVAQGVLEGPDVAHGVLRGELRNDLIQDVRLLSRVLPDSGRVVHHDCGEHEAHGKLHRAGPAREPDCRAQSHHEGRVRGRHPPRAHEPGQVPLPIEVPCREHLGHLREEEGQKSGHQRTVGEDGHICVAFLPSYALRSGGG
mmetsp:Transcript_4843/g.14455  ORF Transcript_4843/g.14455 Transcript_4843/m.14455 type:complete len:205 (+) Transcript_4843:262-876(+)